MTDLFEPNPLDDPAVDSAFRRLFAANKKRNAARNADELMQANDEVRAAIVAYDAAMLRWNRKHYGTA